MPVDSVVVVEWIVLKDGKVLLWVIAVWASVVLSEAPASRESSLRWKSGVLVPGLGFGDVAGPALSLAGMVEGVEFGVGV